jgi:hypothetical protein
MTKLKELTVSLQLLHAQVASGISNPLKNLVLLSKLTMVHNIEPNYQISNDKNFLPLSPDSPLEHIKLDLMQRVPYWEDL